MVETRQDIRKLTRQELKEFFVSQGDKAFRANQVYEWLWQKSATDFAQMTNLSKATREMLEQHFTINNVEIGGQQKSVDRTIKSTMRLFDSNIVEGVLIPTTHRMTACISSQ
ncbi:MAG: 23S rRNA (adenine(2503)-C(2))-methyltransferase RlmN, partial [Cyclobacteriaceae bacterium]|nr:23S rRNA (adenine(2503)-C(2))-methyltransferase RlmN [Cyclobacteriaceae bacterium]